MSDALERLAFAPRRAIGFPASIATSGRRSGSGVDFADYRRYCPGDDPRHVDWNVYARSRKLFSRRFHVDADLCLYLLLDTSGSMGLGGLGRFSKLRFATRLASALAYVAWRGNHAIGIATFSDRLESYLHPSHRREQLGRVVESLRHVAPHGPSDLGRAFAELAARTTRRGLAVVLSDFFTPKGFGKGLTILGGKGFDLAALQIVSEEEVAPEIDGEVEIWDVEAGDGTRLRVSRSAIPRYRERLEEMNAALREQCARRGALHRRLVSSTPFYGAIQALIEAGLLTTRRA